MKYICNAMQEGRCKSGAGKCFHSGRHVAGRVMVQGPSRLNPLLTVLCTEERFCEAQDEMVHCVEVGSFPAMKNPVTISDELAREFVEWVKLGQFCNVSDETLCNKLATRFLDQLK